MTEIAVRAAPVGAAAELVAWAEAAQAAYTLAESLVRTEVCPPPFRGKPAEATAVVMLGAELGVSPIAALRSMYSLRGSIGMYARAQVALVQSRGHSIWTEHESDDMVTVAGHRRGEPDHVERVTWTIARARQAGYIRRGKSNEPSRYELDPRTMLWSRAAGDVARRIAADVLAGIPADLDDPDELTDVRAPAATQRVQRQPRPVTEVELPPAAVQGPDYSTENSAPEPAPGYDENFAGDGITPGQSAEDSDTPEPDDEGEPLVTPAQRRTLHPLFIEVGVRGSDARHAWLAEFLGHEIESTNDLTVTEASAAIDELRRLRGPRSSDD